MGSSCQGPASCTEPVRPHRSTRHVPHPHHAEGAVRTRAMQLRVVSVPSAVLSLSAAVVSWCAIVRFSCC